MQFHFEKRCVVARLYYESVCATYRDYEQPLNSGNGPYERKHLQKLFSVALTMASEQSTERGIGR